VSYALLDNLRSMKLLTKILAVMAFALVTSSSALAATGGCHAVSGTSVTSIVPCTVPAVACRESVVTGDQAGTVLSILTTFDFSTGNYTGYRTNYLANGAVIESSVVGWFGGGFGNSVATITGGTRQYAHATGTVFAESGPNDGTYWGEYCLGNGEKGV
jgi:hypothetical protein